MDLWMDVNSINLEFRKNKWNSSYIIEKWVYLHFKPYREAIIVMLSTMSDSWKYN